jgi:hypothetical protein
MINQYNLNKKRAATQTTRNLPQLQYLFLGLEGFVVRELDHRRLWRKERLVYINLGIDVDGVVTDVEELDDFRLVRLIDCTFS